MLLANTIIQNPFDPFGIVVVTRCAGLDFHKLILQILTDHVQARGRTSTLEHWLLSAEKQQPHVTANIYVKEAHFSVFIAFIIIINNNCWLKFLHNFWQFYRNCM